MKLLVKGKAPADSARFAELGLADGAKIMIMRSAQGAKPTSKAAPAAAVQFGIYHTLKKLSARQ